MIEDATRQLRARQAAWDPLRERRVLARVEAELAARRDRGSWRPRIALAAAFAVAVALVIGVLAWPQPEPARIEPAIAGITDDGRSPTSALPGIPPLPAPAIALVDGSVATLHDGAALELRVQTEHEVRIDQIGGRVHYEVRPGLPRTFVVAAAGVRVEVIGTAFWIAQEPQHVRVTVEHGRVRVGRVDEAAIIAELGAGDELRLERDDVGRIAAAMPDGIGHAAVDPEHGDTRRATTRDGDERRTTPRSPSSRGAKPRTNDDTPRASVDELLARADAAAAARDNAGAIAALREIVEHHAGAPQAYSSAFRLGKLERARGRHAAAAIAFATAARRSPTGTLSADARAEAAIAWFDAGRHAEARAAGDDYLARHPKGEHVARIERMLARLP